MVPQETRRSDAIVTVSTVLLLWPEKSPDILDAMADMDGEDAERGLSLSALEMLPTQMGNGSGPIDQCSICKEDMTPSETIVRLPGCLHTFHR